MNEQDDPRIDPDPDATADLPLDPDPTPGYDAESTPIWPWVVGLAIVATVVAGVVYMRYRPAPTTSTAEATAPGQAPAPAAVATPAALPALGPAVEPVDLPALDGSDVAVRDLLRTLSNHPELAAWLATDGLLRNVAVCIDNLADGKSPARVLKPLAPRAPFSATGGPERYVATPAAFARYDGLAGFAASLDASAVARVYSTVKPRLDQAYQELGHRPGEIDEGVARALAHLLETPSVAAEAPLTRVVLSYRYIDEEVESLSGAQKQLLRMGPRNRAIVQAKLRELAGALGVPPERIPAAR